MLNIIKNSNPHSLSLNDWHFDSFWNPDRPYWMKTGGSQQNYKAYVKQQREKNSSVSNNIKNMSKENASHWCHSEWRKWSICEKTEILIMD